MRAASPPHVAASRTDDRSDHLSTEAAKSSVVPHVRHLLQHTGPRILLVNALALLAARLSLGAFSLSDAALAAAVWVGWPVQEWLLHRYVLHQRPFVLFARRIDSPYGRYHRAHHRAPWRLDKTLVPSWLLAVLVPGQLVWLALLPTRSLSLTAAAAYALAAVVYEWCHYLAHSSFRPRSAFVRRVVGNHRLHHFRSEGHWYSFTWPMIDRWMGTDPPLDSVSPSPTVRTLGVDDEGSL